MVRCQNPDEFLPLQQSVVYADAVKACGAKVRWLTLCCGDALAVERGRMRLVSRGPVWDAGATADDKRRALRQLARWPGLTLVTPEEPISGLGLIPLVTPMHHAIWDLSPGLRPGMAATWRNHLATALRAGLRIEPGGPGTLHHLLTAETAQRRSRRYRALPVAFTHALDPGALRLWQWRQDGQLGAAMAFIRHGTSASYHLAWGSDAARQACVHTAMLTRAAEALFAEGVRWLDLGSVNTEAAPGLARFKLGTGATLHRLGPTLLVLP
ncbi:MAG: GNAT family N-acetyltransferase [Rhodobacterales bacterium]|nr:GNAT family N-acetyltransferase [Rhodobacterales bacterium]